MTVMTAEELIRECAEIDRYVSEMPRGQLPIEHQLAIVSQTLGRTIATLKDVMETLAAHMGSATAESK